MKYRFIFYAFVAIFCLFANIYFTSIYNLIIKREDGRIERVKTKSEVASDAYKELKAVIFINDEVRNR